MNAPVNNLAREGRSLELFFVDGDPEGMLTATVPYQWSGHVLVASRTQLREALQREETSRTGIYILIGNHIETGEPQIYIGESDDIGERIKNHDTKKDWWTKAIFITSNSPELNKAHVKYLESRLIEKAISVNKIKLDNATRPASQKLSEADISNMENFLDNIAVVLPALRFDFFIPNTRTLSLAEKLGQADKADNFSTIFQLKLPKYHLEATAVLKDGYFVVTEGSLARLKWEGKTATPYYAQTLHQNLIDKGVLVPHDSHCVFTKDYAFDSPSAAASVVTGRTSNGTMEWKEKESGKTYKQWEAETLGFEKQAD